MTFPNRLTLARLLLTALFVMAMELSFSWNQTIALVIFLLAILTDYLDGLLARRWHLITNFGKLMDPIADKILSTSAFILLVAYAAIPAWAVIIVIGREFLITGLRLLAGGKGIILPAEKLGKHKTAWQMATILFFLVLLALPEWIQKPSWWHGLWIYGGNALIAITVILTLYSGFGYLHKNRSLLLSD
ncbi:MAG: CDP-diacylglycerol--glycerol-3-phosphate 3-phosphatidyltransferase [Verrucomicrobia bacterium]|nr:MAG: CDP-diacylglycerol--glycerol-3-phosphate 3-phosphatidyltransferase [Verrucomicrobiota bacterium]